MNYLILYCDDKNNTISEIYGTAAISLAIVHANLIAYKNNRKVVNIMQYDYRTTLLDILNENDKNKIIDTISIFNIDDNCTLNQLDNLAINDGIYVSRKEYKHSIEQELRLDNYVIKLKGHYNAYGLIMLNNMIIYKNENMIISEEFENGKKRIV